MKPDYNRIEFGDFQTPDSLANEVCGLLSRLAIQPRTIIEPTCGKGSFVFSALKHFPDITLALCNEIKLTYVQHVKAQPMFKKYRKVIDILNEDFFRLDWTRLTSAIREPITFIGNPPWVTNSNLGSIDSGNLPPKSNFLGLKGFDAITGGSNFDISEWMLIAMADILKRNDGHTAMLVKTSVARRVLTYIWKNEIGISGASIYRIDSMKSFDASVDACLFLCEFDRRKKSSYEATVFDSLDSARPSNTIGYVDDQLIADVDAYNRISTLLGRNTAHVWRSGIKHDCSKVMELKTINGRLVNGLGEHVDIEDTFIYPMLKSSDLAHGREASRAVIITQKKVGENTDIVRDTAPKTWKYLVSHAKYSDDRKSSIYNKNPRFSIFGVGHYTYSKWKVAVSGFYKTPVFRVISKSGNKPTVFDDTCYFLPCENERDANTVADFFNSEFGRDFVNTFAFWDAKRPITCQLLSKLDVTKIAGRSSKTERRANRPLQKFGLPSAGGVEVADRSIPLGSERKRGVLAHRHQVHDGHERPVQGHL